MVRWPRLAPVGSIGYTARYSSSGTLVPPVAIVGGAIMYTVEPLAYICSDPGAAASAGVTVTAIAEAKAKTSNRSFLGIHPSYLPATCQLGMSRCPAQDVRQLYAPAIRTAMGATPR